MRKLSKEELEFIDNYLKNSGVEYIDVRIEMLDHVASAVEAKMEAEHIDFYEAFKSYMIANKKELLTSSTKYSWSIDKTLLLMIFRNLFDLKVLLTFTILAGVLYFVNVFSLMKLYGALILSPLFYLLVPSLIYRKFKYSFFQRFAVYGMITNYVTQYLFLSFLGKEQINIYVLLCIVWINLSIAFSAYKKVKDYNQKLSLT